jgi:hypothetical protein
LKDRGSYEEDCRLNFIEDGVGILVNDFTARMRQVEVGKSANNVGLLFDTVCKTFYLD